MKSTLKRALALFAAFFALYALTAQRGLSWGDSGEFQYRILELSTGVLSGCDSLPTAHPLYVALGKLVASSPFQVTLLSPFFGALAVAGLFLATRSAGLAVLFGLSHALWWLSTLAEVQTLSLAFTAFETVLLLKLVERPRDWMFFVLFLLNGIHLWVHHFALLALPVYAAFVFAVAWKTRRARPVLLSALGGLLATGLPLYAFALTALDRGLVVACRMFLVGRYGAQVAGWCPSQPAVTLFNFALMSLSFAVPAVLARISWREKGGVQSQRGGGVPAAAGKGSPAVSAQGASESCGGGDAPAPVFLWALFLIHALFVLRYFVPDQFTFALPALFYAYVLLARVRLGVNRLVALALMEVLLPVAAAHFFAQFERPARATAHPGRDDATYFAHPWKCCEDSAARYAEHAPKPWKGYP